MGLIHRFFVRSALILGLFIHSALALIGIDVDTFTYDDHKKTVLRVVYYDVTHMEFKAVGHFEYDPKNAGSPPVDLKLDLLKIDGNPIKSLRVRSNGEVHLGKDFDFKSYFVRSEKLVSFPSKKASELIDCGKHLVLIKKIPPQKGKTIVQSIEAQSASKPEVTDKFKVRFVPLNANEKNRLVSFSEMFPVQKDNSDERGRLGEIATDLIMLGNGFSKLASQKSAKGIQGFDGIFITRFGGNELFLTESKCRSVNEGAESYFKEDLSERAIFRKYNQLLKKNKETYGKVTPFLKGNGEVFRFAQSVLHNGNSQFYAKKLNHNFYCAENVTKKSELSTKENAARHLMTLFDSPQKFIEAAFRVALEKDPNLDVSGFLEVSSEEDSKEEETAYESGEESNVSKEELDPVDSDSDGASQSQKASGSTKKKMKSKGKEKIVPDAPNKNKATSSKGKGVVQT